jgi:hypothetical protein
MKRDYNDNYYIKKYGARGIKFEAGFKIPNTHWVVVDGILHHGDGVKIMVLCICGKQYLRSLSSLTSKHPIVWCAQCKQRNSKKCVESDWTGTPGIPSHYYTRTKDSAKKRNISFEISNEEMYKLYVEQSRSCALTGVPISFTDKNKASLDRIDSSIGYTSNNVQWVHKDINRMKSVFPQEHFVSLCHAVANNTPKPNNIFEKLGFKPNGA